MEYTFQFLIGRLKTILRQAVGIEIPGFQFLIGRLKTLSWFTCSASLGPVSIPHRKAKNMVAKDTSVFGFLFQFLIGRLKTNGCSGGKKGGKKFQFLIGRLKTTLAENQSTAGL